MTTGLHTYQPEGERKDTWRDRVALYWIQPNPLYLDTWSAGVY